MVGVSLAFFAGTLLACAWPGYASPTAPWALALGAAICAGCAGFRLMSARAATALPSLAGSLPLLAAVAAGLAWELFAIRAALATRWPAARDGERVLVAAEVDGLPARKSTGLAFDAWIVPATGGLRLHARLLWRDAPGAQPRAGETWQLMTALNAPVAAVNPGSGDGERQLFRDRIDATGTIVASSPLNKRISVCGRCLDAWRERIADHFRRVVDDRDAGALIAALAVGATGEMSSDQWRIFAATGTTHLVAISGSHVTLFALGAMLLARIVWRYGLCGRVPVARESFAAAFGLAASAAYAALAGLSVPTLRTLLMLAAWQAGILFARSTAALASLCAALVVILLLDPFAALSSGFWLSFTAIVVIGLTSGANVLHRHASRGAALWNSARLQWALFLALAPLTLAWFGSLSLAGLLVNILAIPLIGWVLVPLVLAALALAPLSVALSDHLAVLAAHVAELLWPAMEAIANGSLAQLHVQPPPWWPALAAAAAVLLLPWPSLLRIAVLAAVTALAGFPPRPRAGAVEVTVLDVGDASTIVARTRTHVLVYGLGDRFGGEGGTVSHVLVPFLQGVGADHVDLAVLGRSSAHGSPGLTTLLASMNVSRVGLPHGVPLDFPQAQVCADDARWMWDGVLFESSNAVSGCVLRIVAGKQTVMLSGEGTVREPAPVSDIAILRGNDPAFPSALRVLSTRKIVARAAGLSTGGSGAVQFTLGPAPDSASGADALMPIEWRRRPAGPWRTRSFGL